MTCRTSAAAAAPAQTIVAAANPDQERRTGSDPSSSFSDHDLRSVSNQKVTVPPAADGRYIRTFGFDRAQREARGLTWCLPWCRNDLRSVLGVHVSAVPVAVEDHENLRGAVESIDDVR